MKTIKIYAVAVMAYFFFIVASWLLLFQPLTHSQERWSQEQVRYLSISKHLITLSKEFGFGGLIHNFKNYVLRRDTAYLEATNESVVKLEQTFKVLNAELTSQEESALLRDLQNTYLEYKNHYLWIKSNLSLMEQLDTTALDKRVRVDDRLAFKALRQLITNNNQSYMKVQQSLQNTRKQYQYQLIVWFSVCSVMYWGMFALVKVFLLRFNRNYTQLQTINELSPSAMILVDKHGKILQINPAFKKMFRVPDNLNINGSSIELFIPKSQRERHAKLRNNFQHSDRSVAMDKRDAGFQARRLDGEVFPIDIAISSINHDDVEMALAIVMDKSEEAKLKEQAELDFLTNIYNRRFMESEMSRALEDFERINRCFSILLIDIDNFKTVNDTLGHDEGDLVLTKTVKTIQANIRSSDLLARWGGDEFLCMLPGVTLDDAEQLAHKLVKSVQKAFSSHEIKITISVGVAQAHIEQNMEQLIKQADDALYQVKENGRNGFACYRDNGEITTT